MEKNFIPWVQSACVHLPNVNLEGTNIALGFGPGESLEIRSIICGAFGGFDADLMVGTL